MPGHGLNMKHADNQALCVKLGLSSYQMSIMSTIIHDNDQQWKEYYININIFKLLSNK